MFKVIGRIAKSFFGGIGREASNLGKVLWSGVSNVWNKYTGSGLTDAEKEANAFTAAREDLAWSRQMDAANSAHQREVADLKAAGLNPMLAYGMSGAPSPSASSSGSVSPGSGNLSDLLSILALPSQLKDISAGIDLKKAQAEDARASAKKKIEEERGAKIVNDIKEATSSAQIEMAKYEAAIKKIGVEKVNQEINQIQATIEKLRAEADTEESRQSLMFAQEFLAKVNADNAQVLLPYQKMLLEAQTDEAKAAAVLSAVKAAYDQRIINSGYIDSMAREMAASAGVKENSEAITDIATAMRTGDYTKVQEKGWLRKDFTWRIVQGLTTAFDNLNPIAGLLSSAFSTAFK